MSGAFWTIFLENSRSRKSRSRLRSKGKFFLDLNNMTILTVLNFVKVATKCIRVSSTADANQIIQTLIEKFRPDMKMLEVPEYALYEVNMNICRI